MIILYINPDTENRFLFRSQDSLRTLSSLGYSRRKRKIPSTNEISALLNINPHTVLKGMNLLVDEGIIYKKRGLGMFVKEGAVEKIRRKRQGQFYDQYIAAMIAEASKLKMTKEEIIALVERGYENERNSD